MFEDIELLASFMYVGTAHTDIQTVVSRRKLSKMYIRSHGQERFHKLRPVEVG